MCRGPPSTQNCVGGTAQLGQAVPAASLLLLFLTLWRHPGGSAVDSGLQKTSPRGSPGNFPHRCMRNKGRAEGACQAVPEPLQPAVSS